MIQGVVPKVCPRQTHSNHPIAGILSANESTVLTAGGMPDHLINSHHWIDKLVYDTYVTVMAITVTYVSYTSLSIQ